MPHHRTARLAWLVFLIIGVATLLLVAPLAAAPGNVKPDPPQTRLPRVSVEDGRLIAGGSSFEVRGVNYTHTSTTPPGCPELHFGADSRCRWDQAAIDADFERMRALGVNTVRVFLNYYVFGGARADTPGYTIEPALDHLEALVESANRRGIYVMPVLLAKYPQDQFTPEGFARALDWHVRPVVGRLANKSGILAWDLFNEPDIGSPIDARCWDWDNGDFPLCLQIAEARIAFLTRLHYEVKWIDPAQMTTIGMAFAKSYFRPEAVSSPLAGLVDFYSFHYYDDEPYDSGRYVAHWYYGEGLPRDLHRGIAELRALRRGKPVVVSELGFPSGEGHGRDKDDLRRDLRIGLQASREAGATGVVLWPFQTSLEELVGDLFTAP